MTINAFPLTWPPTFPRAKQRESGRFKASLSSSLKNVQESLRLFAADSGKKLENLTISSNVTLGAHKPTDPGVAVWFVWDGLQVCIAVDRYSSIEGNLQAIHHIVEARRVELRHGTLALVRATFQGFKALPTPAGKGWREVLMVNVEREPHDFELVRGLNRKLASANHPDKGGSAERMAEINRAWEQAQKEMA
jgi:hypothetical protein